MPKKLIVFITGPTAVGKTETAIELARVMNAEIISCDSMQVYKNFSVLSQVPSKKQLKTIKHHLIAAVPASKIFNVADYRDMALKIIRLIHKKNKNVIFSGGSPMYIKAMTDGIFTGPKTDALLRRKLIAQSKKQGQGFLYEKLKNIDPETARNIHPNDSRRILRALEVCIKSGEKMSHLKKNTKGLAPDYDIRIFCINMQREKLYSRINLRVEKMFAAGAVKEVKDALGRKISKTASSMLGFKEIKGYLSDEYDKEQAKFLLKQNTRRFAKRQLSWFRNDKKIKFVDISDTATPFKTAQLIMKDIHNE